MSNTLPHLLAGVSGPSVPQPQPSASSAAPAHEASKHALATGPRKSVVTNMLKSASARRRAGANELAHLKKAKRSLPAKRAVAVRAGTFTAEFRLPASRRKSAPENDVEMKDVEQEEEKREAKVSITLPARLGRPKFKRVPIEKALFMNEALKDVPIEYIQDELARKGQKYVVELCLWRPVAHRCHPSRLLSVLEYVSVRPPLPSTIPKEVAIEVSDAPADLPTHMLAVYKKDLPAGARNVVTMLAVHQCVWDINCAHVPSLPPSTTPTPSPSSSSELTRVTIPVIPLGLPNPEAFRELLCYIYTKRADELLAELLPAPPPSAVHGQDALDRYARSLAGSIARGELMRRMARVQGVWRNACALGVFDDGLWAMLDLAWDVYAKAVVANVPGRPAPVWDGSLAGLSASFAR